jgi:pimeloyl-ACP methyl ester carboxylesterase
VLCFDGPGQGSMIIDQDVPFRPDWEAVVTPVVDFALARPDVDPERLALIGLSFGGYLAPRAATAEHRLAACVSDCGPYDLFQTSASRLPGPFARQLPDGNPAVLRLLGRILGFVMNQPTAGWALRRNVMVHGLSDPLEFFRIAADYSLRGREHLISCPTLICAAEGDDLSSRAHELFDNLTCEKTFVEFRTADGASEHCESGARTHFHHVAFDWLDASLKVNQPTG